MSFVVIVIVFLLISLLSSSVYVLMLPKKEERILQYWALSWVAYSFSILCIILYSVKASDNIHAIRDLFDMVNIMFLMCSVYSFAQIKIPKFWKWIVMALCVWGLAGIIFSYDLFTIFIPISALELAMTVLILIIIIRFREPGVSKWFSFILFLIWGAGKAAVSILELLYHMNSIIYLTEVLFSNVLNYAIIITFLHRQIALLVKSKRDFKVIADNSSDVVFLYNLKSQNFEYISPVVENITGYTQEEWYEGKISVKELTEKKYHEVIDDLFNPESYKYSDEKQNRFAVFTFKHRDGTEMHGELKTAHVIEDKEAHGMVGIIHDISAMKKAEQELITLSQAKGNLMSYISHELRIPMTTIIGYIDALRDGVIKDDEAKAVTLDKIYRATMTLNRQIEDLFALSMLENGQVSMNFTINSIDELVRDLVNIHEDSLPATDVSVKIIDETGDAGDLRVVADKERINQVVSNLVVNAKKFSEPKAEVRLRFGIDRRRENFCISVSDDGIGIPDENIKSIFDRFFTSGNEERGHRGSGIGLTLSKEIVEAHKGKISVESKEGIGSTFSIFLPLYFDKTIDK